MKAVNVMENLIFSPVCTCGCLATQATATQCEICMGYPAPEQPILEEIIPETRFDEDYFEGLERLYEARPQAA